ncbi:hypothetical protein [Allosphingosinicella vermicomposti]|uniref:hypothetical protein n=1 Tax=Allosphingosinicella vermicomposti TaxID=614671 RepID=UPI0018F8AB8D|nr:hypothetical protein [Allosphingosinicella vermicomposti]
MDETEVKARFQSQYVDPAFDGIQTALDAVTEAVWQGYSNHRKAPHAEKSVLAVPIPITISPGLDRSGSGDRAGST